MVLKTLHEYQIIKIISNDSMGEKNDCVCVCVCAHLPSGWVEREKRCKMNRIASLSLIEFVISLCRCWGVIVCACVNVLTLHHGGCDFAMCKMKFQMKIPCIPIAPP